MGFVKARGVSLFYEEFGDGVPILLIHPAGATASTWGSVACELDRIGRVVVYDRRGYAQSKAEPVRSIAEHTLDAASLLDTLRAAGAVVVGTSVGATIAIDLALRRPDLVSAVIAYESPWRATWHPSASGVGALARMHWLRLRGRPVQAAEAFLRWAYTYRDGGSAWDAFPDEWRDTATRNATAVLADVRIAVGGYPPPKELAKITLPVVCAHGTRSGRYMSSITRSLAGAIPTARLQTVEGAGHAVAFDAPGNFVHLIGEAIDSGEPQPGG